MVSGVTCLYCEHVCGDVGERLCGITMLCSPILWSLMMLSCGLLPVTRLGYLDSPKSSSFHVTKELKLKGTSWFYRHPGLYDLASTNGWSQVKKMEPPIHVVVTIRI